MIKVSSVFYSTVALVFVFLSLLGYQLATSIFIPLFPSGVTSTFVTYPYRAVVLALAVILIVTRPIVSCVQRKGPLLKVFLVFIFIYLARILIDIFLREIYVLPSWRTTVVQYMFLSIIPSIWAVTKCARYIDYNRLNTWLMWGGVILLGMLVVNQNSLIQAEYDEMTRINANIALGTIGLGHTGVSVFFILLTWFLTHKYKVIWKLVLFVMMGVSIVIMLRAASRGPLVTFFVLILIFIFSKVKWKALAFVITSILVVVVLTNIDSVIDYLGRISPLMEERMAASIYEDDSSGRDSLYENAFDIFLRNPILGNKFVCDNGFYSHNSVLDVMMALGIFGGLIWLYLIIKVFSITYRRVLTKSYLMLVCLLSMQFILKGMFSGTLYTDNSLIVCMVIVCMMGPCDRQELDKKKMPGFRPL